MINVLLSWRWEIPDSLVDYCMDSDIKFNVGVKLQKDSYKDRDTDPD